MLPTMPTLLHPMEPLDGKRKEKILGWNFRSLATWSYVPRKRFGKKI
jgi:hypothetical protein